MCVRVCEHIRLYCVSKKNVWCLANHSAVNASYIILKPLFLFFRCSVWRNHPKLLGPGALIFVAKQLWPKLALSGSSSSEASIKPRYSRISRQHSHEGEPRDYNTEHFIHLRVIAAERKFITNQVQNSKVLQSSIYSNYSSLIVQRKHKTSNERKWRIDKAHTKHVTQREGGQHQLKGHPTQQTNPEARYTAK